MTFWETASPSQSGTRHLEATVDNHCINRVFSITLEPSQGEHIIAELCAGNHALGKSLAVALSPFSHLLETSEDTSSSELSSISTPIMGLALHNYSDPPPLSNLAEDRQLPTRSEVEISSGQSCFWATETSHAPFTRHENDGPLRSRQRRRHHAPPAPGKSIRARQRWDLDATEGRDIARSSFRLPSDGHRGRRPPSLERQEAFRDGRTAKKRACLASADDLSDEDLYRLGLLYDDEHERGSGFTFDAIVRSEPLYKLNVRPIKRGRQDTNLKNSFGGQFDLPLDLSFAGLGDDEALAQFLISPEESELEYEEDVINSALVASAAEVLRPSLTAIYELEPDGSTSFALHNSTISISKGTNSRTHSLTNTALDANDLPDLPALLPDNHDDNDNQNDETSEWEIVPTCNTLLHNPEAATNKIAQETNATPTAENTTPANPEAWVLLS